MPRRWRAFIFLAALLVTTLSFASFASAHTDDVKVLHLRGVQVESQLVDVAPKGPEPSLGDSFVLSENLLRDAITRSVQVAQDIGVRAIVMHALHDQARSFYTRYQFEPSPTDPLHLMLLIKDAKAIVPALQEDRDTARRELTEAMVATGADRNHLESLTNEQFRRLMAVMALTHANELRKVSPDGADDALAAAREATDHGCD